ncbi:DUF1622 domain-containing protein [Euhalothece natronophila Z-M001]|uniref:DUF1622 domain-containing protein n=1 Tax=Euhalothece natronophila Z-M001 TaxID=522448 RepID=A0A5B8NML7_9CHRO|nr:DUF1622 domain-containing protein [Euhalothece natronophila]QDZ39359.1 DUF1622 domain-containing protein [Euhalothece natronophila Z-M001]
MIIEVWSQDIANIVRILNNLMISFCQLLSLMIIFFGVVRALIIYVGDGLFRGKAITAFQESRLSMSYSFSLGLSFLIGASILKTTASSQWEDFAQLTAIITVRTVLNLLLERAIKQGKTSIEKEAAPPI